MQRDGDITHLLCRSAQPSDMDRAIRTSRRAACLPILDKLGRQVSGGQLKRPEKSREL
jgi:hypothetical protein